MEYMPSDATEPRAALKDSLPGGTALLTAAQLTVQMRTGRTSILFQSENSFWVIPRPPLPSETRSPSRRREPRRASALGRMSAK